MDVARILVRTPDELATTDIADYALEALRASKVREVYILGRRGPAQAAFTPPELKELGELADADVFVRPEEAALDPLSEASLVGADRGTVRNVELLQEFSRRPAAGKQRKLYMRFLVSPVELLGDEHGRVRAMRLVRNELYATEAGSLRPRATGDFETLPVGLVFRSIGYRGVALPGVPFHEKWGVILNRDGRVLDPNTQEPRVGEYASGWIKRGPSGVIGTNKPDSVETVENMLRDLAEGKHLTPEQPEAQAAEALVAARQPDYFTYDHWRRLDALETARGEALGRPRLKFTAVDEMLRAREQEVEPA
jgi:ferredoxin--NADP+ reductase